MTSKEQEQYKGNDFYCDKVFSGEVAVRKVFETDTVLAFHHTRPSYPVHIVVVPKIHVSSLLELQNPELLGDIIGVVQRVSSDIVDQYGSCRVVTNLGEYQDSKHLHFHLSYGDHLPSK